MTSNKTSPFTRIPTAYSEPGLVTKNIESDTVLLPPSSTSSSSSSSLSSLESAHPASSGMDQDVYELDKKEVEKMPYFLQKRIADTFFLPRIVPSLDDVQKFLDSPEGAIVFATKKKKLCIASAKAPTQEAPPIFFTPIMRVTVDSWRTPAFKTFSSENVQNAISNAKVEKPEGTEAQKSSKSKYKPISCVRVQGKVLDPDEQARFTRFWALLLLTYAKKSCGDFSSLRTKHPWIPLQLPRDREKIMDDFAKLEKPEDIREFIKAIPKKSETFQSALTFPEAASDPEFLASVPFKEPAEYSPFPEAKYRYTTPEIADLMFPVTGQEAMLSDPHLKDNERKSAEVARDKRLQSQGILKTNLDFLSQSEAFLFPKVWVKKIQNGQLVPVTDLQQQALHLGDLFVAAYSPLDTSFQHTKDGLSARLIGYVIVNRAGTYQYPLGDVKASTSASDSLDYVEVPFKFGSFSKKRKADTFEEQVVVPHSSSSSSSSSTPSADVDEFQGPSSKVQKL
jgi:hypothetical protein